MRDKQSVVYDGFRVNTIVMRITVDYMADHRKAFPLGHAYAGKTE
jgi:hypothetical protein